MPRAMYRDPFRMGDNILVMCDTYEPPRPQKDGSVIPMKPLPTNTRFACAEVMEKTKDQEPWFGIEQVCVPLKCESPDAVLTLVLVFNRQRLRSCS